MGEAISSTSYAQDSSVDPTDDTTRAAIEKAMATRVGGSADLLRARTKQAGP